MNVSTFDTLPLEETLEDLSARFIVNLPAEELESLDRVCFQIEQASVSLDASSELGGS